MINRPPHHRAPGLAWALTVLVLMAGIVAMHSAVFGTAHASTSGAEHAAGTHAVGAPAGSETRPAARPAPAIQAGSAADHRPHSEPVFAALTAAATAPHAGRADTETMTLPVGPATGTTADDHAAVAPSSAAAPAAGLMPVAVPNTSAPAEDPHAGSGCGSAGCDEHAAVHSCVFVLVALAAAMALVLLYRLTDDLAAIVAAAARPWRGRRERPPPWTVLSLAQLAILRI
ncbi:hypothetical protein [Nocardia asteroides]|uniref:hypothetical protein n=1 Tax=Nocardia asteroides TaxID=1824 RepID=UPI001E3FFB6D|nr:hypothetical protein [Nocardia asteroides]UGT57699.1 hypothetical protein LTT85_13025 [Nocardia asteroides]